MEDQSDPPKCCGNCRLWEPDALVVRGTRSGRCRADIPSALYCDAYPVCDSKSGSDCPCHVPKGQPKLSAAPDLLAALEELDVYVRRWNKSGHILFSESGMVGKRISAIRATIARAKEDAKP